MRIPFDLIAAVLCVEGIGRYILQTMRDEAGPAHLSIQAANLFSPGSVLLIWAGFVLVSWLLNELVIRHVEWRTRFGQHITGFSGKRHPLVTLAWGTNAAQAATVVLYAAILWWMKWPLWVTQWPQWLGLA